LNRQGTKAKFMAGGRNILFLAACSSVVGLTQLPVRHITGTISFGVKWLMCEATYFHLVLKFGILGAISPFPPMF
jgi:hypothetical protein